jgi:hypothetical protein
MLFSCMIFLCDFLIIILCDLMLFDPTRFPRAIFCCLLHNFLMRCYMLFGRYEMSLCDFMLFAALFSYEIYPNETSCFWGPLRALRMRFFVLVWP